MTVYAYRLPDGSDDSPDLAGQHTKTVNVMHSAEQASRFPGCEHCRALAASCCLVCFNIPATSAFSGWDESRQDFAVAIHHGPRGCGNAACELCVKYAAGWCQTCEKFTMGGAR